MVMRSGLTNPLMLMWVWLSLLVGTSENRVGVYQHVPQTAIIRGPTEIEGKTRSRGLGLWFSFPRS